MAELVGSRLTSEIIRKIGGESNRGSKEAILITTVDELGFPNSALMSYLDLCIISSKRLLFAIGESSSTKKNLLRTPRAGITLWLGKNLGIYYLKGRTRLVKGTLSAKPEGHPCSALVLKVERVTRDYLPEARILSTITYSGQAVNEGHLALLSELKHLSRSI